jgi:hypothetical protein
LYANPSNSHRLSVFNPFIFIINKRRVNSPLQIVMAVWCTFWGPAAENNGCLACFKFHQKSAIIIFGQMPHPKKSFSRIVCKGRRALKAVQTLLGLISRPILDLCFFFKSQWHHKKQEGYLRKSRYS